VVVKHQNVSQRIRSEREAQIRTQLLDVVDAAVIATDAGGTVTHWSAGAERLYGWSAEEACGRAIWELSVGVSPAADVIDAVREHGRWEGELEGRHRTGTAFPTDVRLTAIVDDTGQLTGIAGVGVDVSERHRQACELPPATTCAR
jgi:PAS domain S-box-containing protein